MNKNTLFVMIFIYLYFSKEISYIYLEMYLKNTLKLFSPVKYEFRRSIDILIDIQTSIYIFWLHYIDIFDIFLPSLFI